MNSDFFPTIPSKKAPTAPRQIVRIALGETASRILDDTGLPAFGVIGCERQQGEPRKWILYLCEPRHESAQAAIEIMKAGIRKQSNESES